MTSDTRTLPTDPSIYRNCLIGYPTKFRMFKEKWLAALRSGDYKQGTDRLCTEEDDGTRFCCLGVALDLLDPSGWKQKDTGAPMWKKFWAGDVEPVAPVIGINSDTARILSQRNDGACGYSKHNFEQIADWIEANL